MTPAAILFCYLLGPLTVTTYQSVASQTDTSPNYTSIGQKTRKGGIAVSRDLLCPVNKYCRRNVHMFCNPNKLHYGDYVWIKGLGIYQVNDCMGLTKYVKEKHKRVPIRNSVDVWVASYQEEKAFDDAHGESKWTVYRVKLDEK